MKGFYYYFQILILFICLCFSACKKDSLSITSTNNNFNGGGNNSNTSFPVNGTILPLGDSRVEGFSPTYESYRYELWKNLVDKGWSFDFVGSKIDESEYISYNGLDFDIDHEGTGGATTADNLETLKEILTPSNAPHVVLLGIGGNDLLNGLSVNDAIDNINQIIDILQSNKSTVTIFIEQIAPAQSSYMTTDLTQTIENFNNNILSVASQQTDGESNVISIDMYSNWSDTYMADDVHYNSSGAKEIADRYMNAIDAFY